MKTARSVARFRKKQSGYALLIVVFLTTLVLVASMSIGLRVLTEGRRQKEQDMIWRGKQYTRGIKLYYQKFGRFPTSLDDLIKPSVGNIRFMRQAYKDPMNKEDGSWRLIYVGPAGQLIGSLKPQPGGIQMPVAGGQPGAPGTAPSGFGAQPGTMGGISTGGVTPSAPPNGTGSGTAGTGAATGTDTQGQGTGTSGTDSQSALTADTPTIMGGNIIGVGSKVNKPSIMVYDKATNYRLFEFIWDPSKDMGIVGTPGTTIGTPAGTPGAPGQSPMGGQPMGGQPNPPNPGPPPLSNPNPPQQ
ncbi:MAG TPA: hypothetical protein VMI32_19675 [Candidatus Solibacter sp.]|nr:hypothetical protein [Candidatus Solibacter sp.]